jgi:hypothetical protein
LRIFVTKTFDRFVEKQSITDVELSNAVATAENGLIEADLGGGVIKLRLARKGQGKSGGYRTILAFRAGEVSFFVFGYPKSERANITRNELQALKLLAKNLFGLDDSKLSKALAHGELREVISNE